MIAFEVIKQLVLTFYVGKGSYQWFCFPFQLCSIPMYLCVIAGITKNERLYDACCGFLATFGLLGGVCAFIDTSGFQYTVMPLTVYSYVWHILLILIGIFSAVIRKRKIFLQALIIFAVCSLAAELINIPVTLLFGADINMFYINPLVPTNQVAVKDAAKLVGNTAALFLYWLSCILGAFLINKAEAAIKNIRQKHQ